MGELELTLNKLKALADEVRFRLLFLLIDRESCVCDLENALQMSQPRISQQLNKLKNAGLIKDKMSGKWKYYSLTPEGKAFIGQPIARIFQSVQNSESIQTDLDRLKTHTNKPCGGS